jgi:beta-mannosidase
MNGAFADMDAWREYWRADDSLFRSEVGMPGAQDEALTERYSGGNAYWPPEGEYWRHTAAWWTQWQRLREEMDGATFADYVARTQADQAEAYRIAATQCRRRFPKCGGFIVWHGHDCFPCPANNSIIDFDRKPKPACHALREVFRAAPKDLPKV